MVREGTVSNVWTAGRGERERGDCKIYCRRSGARVVLQFCYNGQAQVWQCQSWGNQWTAETLVTSRDSCQERDTRDNQQEFSLRLSPPPVLLTPHHGPCLARTKSCAVFYSRFHISQCVTHRSDHPRTRDTYPYLADCIGSLEAAVEILTRSADSAWPAPAWPWWRPGSCPAHWACPDWWLLTSGAPGVSAPRRMSPPGLRWPAHPPRGLSCLAGRRCRAAAEASGDSSRKLSWWCEVCRSSGARAFPEDRDKMRNYSYLARESNISPAPCAQSSQPREWSRRCLRGLRQILPPGGWLCCCRGCLVWWRECPGWWTRCPETRCSRAGAGPPWG